MSNSALFTFMGSYISVLFFWVAIFYFGIASVVIYILARVRNAKSLRQDSQIGTKVALHFLLSLSVFIGVLGGSIVLVDQLLRLVTDSNLTSLTPSRPDPFNTPETRSELLTAATRAGFGMVLAGVILGLGQFWLLYSRTNDRRWPAVRRSFVGSRSIVHGIVVTTAVTIAFVVGLQEATEALSDIRKRILVTCLGVLGVWGTSLTIHLGLLFRYTRQADVPGESFRCDECGEDLRGKLSGANDIYCPGCRSVLSIHVRRTLSSLSAATPPVAVVSATPKPPEPTSDSSEE